MKALFKSELNFRTDAAEDAFMEWVSQRFHALRKQQGVDSKGVYSNWMKKRVDWENEFHNDFSHRQADPRYGKLYELYGTSDNVPKRAISVFSARTRDQLLNNDQFVSLMPEGPEDEINQMPTMPGGPTPINPIREAERYWRRKLVDTKVRHNLRGAIQRAGYVGECVIKTSRAILPFDGQVKARVWLDRPDGEALTDSVGRYIYDDDTWEASADVAGAECLRRDPMTLKPEGAVISDQTYPVRDRPPSRALTVEPVNFRDFVCSTVAHDIHKTDYIAQTFDYDVDQLLNATYGAKMSAEAKDWLEKQSDKVRDSLNQSESGQPNPIFGEVEDIGCESLGKIHLAESWLRFNVSGRPGGRTQEVYVLWCIDDKHPIYYDFIENVSPTGRRPYRVIRPIPVPDRWYGMSFYELLSNEHNFVDLQKTRLNHRNSRNSSVKFLRQDSIAEVEAGWKFDINMAHVWNFRAGSNNDREAPLKIVELPKIDEGIWQMLADARQNAKLMSGTILPSDAAAADLNESKTLGQTQLLNSESELMGSDIGEDTVLGIVESMQDSVICCFADFNEPEHREAMVADMCEILGSQRGKELERWLESNSPRRLMNNLRLTMSKQRSRELMTANVQAKQLLVGELTWVQIEAMGPQYADRFRQLFTGILTNLDVPNAESLTRAPAVPMVDPNAGLAPPGGAAPSPDVTTAPERPETSVALPEPQPNAA